jgi:hypothetical protein
LTGEEKGESDPSDSLSYLFDSALAQDGCFQFVGQRLPAFPQGGFLNRTRGRLRQLAEFERFWSLELSYSFSSEINYFLRVRCRAGLGRDKCLWNFAQGDDAPDSETL